MFFHKLNVNEQPHLHQALLYEALNELQKQQHLHLCYLEQLCHHDLPEVSQKLIFGKNEHLKDVPRNDL